MTKMRNMIVTLIASLSAAAAFAQPDLSEVRVFGTDHLWQSNLDVGETARWDGKHRAMTISPTTASGVFYMPHDLRDAWRELDRMLPQNYILAAASLSAKACLANASNELIALHNALADFGYESWVAPKQSPYRKYLVRIFDFTPPSSVTAVEYDREVGKSAMGWTLCYYYQQKHDPNSFNMALARADLKQQLEKLRATWKQPLRR
jgi:hypothetical protein